MYSYDDRSVEVINSTYQPGLNLSVTAKLFDAQLHERFNVTVPVDVAADGVAKAGAFPERAFDPASPVYFVDLVLKDQFGKILSTNFYWLSSKKNVYDWSAADNDAFTPVKSYEDLTALSSLPSAGKLDVTHGTEESGGVARIFVELKNQGTRLAFQVHIALGDRATGAEIPLPWRANYVSLLPGESTEIGVVLPSDEILNRSTEIRITGWNIDQQTIVVR